MTEPITITNQAALEQGQRVAREQPPKVYVARCRQCGNIAGGACADGSDTEDVGMIAMSAMKLGYEFALVDGPVRIAPACECKAAPPAACDKCELLRKALTEIAERNIHFSEIDVVDENWRQRRAQDALLALPREVSPAEQETPADEPRIGSAADYDFEREAKAWKDDAPAYSSTLCPEIPPHIQYLRQLPAAKAGQSIEEAAADEIKRLREKCDRYKNIILANAFPLTPDPDAVAALTAERDALLSQLPDGMKHCTIQVKECENGHARLTATNWIDHGCHWCELAALAERESRMREALTPSAETKAAYSGEFSFPQTYTDEDGNEQSEPISVPWTTIKEIMKAIAARAALSPPDPSGLDKPVAVSQTERDRDTLDARITEVESLRSEWMASTHLNNQSRFDAYRDACKELIEDLIAGYRARDAENSTLREQLTEADEQPAKLKTIVRERTHREQGCLCDRCVEDEYQTAEVVGKLRREAEAAKGALRRLLGTTRRYLEEREPSDAELADPGYVSPIEQAEAVLGVNGGAE